MSIRRIHFSSGVSGVIPGLGSPLRREAHIHAGGRADTEVIELHSKGELLQHLQQFKASGLRLDYLDFHTHGGAGSIQLGSDSFDRFDLGGRRGRFHNQQFDQLFRPGARIAFHGCNVANDAEGELFLAKVAYVFLRSNGGTASGHTGYALSTQAWGLEAGTPLYVGQEVQARVNSQGTVILRNNAHLLPGRMRLSATMLRSRARLGLSWRSVGPEVRRHLQTAIRQLDDIIHRTHQHPSYQQLYDDYQMLTYLRDYVNRMMPDVHVEYGPD